MKTREEVVPTNSRARNVSTHPKLDPTLAFARWLREFPLGVYRARRYSLGQQITPTVNVPWREREEGNAASIRIVHRQNSVSGDGIAAGHARPRHERNRGERAANL